MIERRHSRKREAMLELLRSSRIHPSALWVYQQLKPEFQDLSLGTVYRNLKVLIEEGKLASAGVVNGEERFDGEPSPHPHAVCKRCGRIHDLAYPVVDALTGIPELPHALTGFVIDSRNTVFYGLCTECEKATTIGR